MSDAPNSGAPSAPAAQQPVDSAAPAQANVSADAAAAVIANPNATQAQKVAAVKKLNSLKIKVDGQEYEEKLPFEIDESNKDAIEYMKRQLQFSKVSQKRMGEKAQLENEVRQAMDQLRKDPKKFLSDPSFGVDLKKLAAAVIEEEIANAAKSPEQLEKEKLQKELEELKAARKKESEEQQSREQTRLTEMEYERYDNLMTSALDKSDLPKSPYVVKKMADYMIMGVKEGLDVTPEDVLPLVREEILEDIRQMAQAMPLETIEKLFGGDILSKIRKKNIAKSKANPQTAKAKLPDVGATPAAKKDGDDKTPKKTIKQLWGV